MVANPLTPEARVRALQLIQQIENHCPCGARPESPRTHPHVGGCPVADLAALLADAPAERDDRDERIDDLTARLAQANTHLAELGFVSEETPAMSEDLVARLIEAVAECEDTGGTCDINPGVLFCCRWNHRPLCASCARLEGGLRGAFTVIVGDTIARLQREVEWWQKTPYERWMQYKLETGRDLDIDRDIAADWRPRALEGK